MHLYVHLRRHAHVMPLQGSATRCTLWGAREGRRKPARKWKYLTLIRTRGQMDPNSNGHASLSGSASSATRSTLSAGRSYFSCSDLILVILLRLGLGSWSQASVVNCIESQTLTNIYFVELQQNNVVG